MSATIVVDAFWGDSGKGKIAAYLAQRDKSAYCVRAGTGTNAGHSLYLDEERVLKTHQIPLAGLFTDAQLRVGSGVAVDPERFIEEVMRYDVEYATTERTRVDGRCPVILPEYREREKTDSHLTDQVGSTQSGTGVALAEFRMRRAPQAKDIPELESYCCDVAREVNEACAAGESVIIEGSQGTQLSLALTQDYPYCTSDNCTTAALADDVGLNWQHISEVVLVVKALPSRVGEGALPFQMSEGEQDSLGIAEFGVTTGRRRRKASQIPWELLKEAVMLNGPTQIALTFCDHYDPVISNQLQLTPKVQALIDQIEEIAQVPVTLVETGKLFEAIVETLGVDD